MKDVEARTVTLADGRTLSRYEFGDQDGVPCLYFPGWPASGLGGGPYDDAAREGGVRWISIDKPGTGRSDAAPGQSLSRYAEDIAQLADQLGLERFAVVGESGGAPHALALAHGLGDRVTHTLVLGGIGPAHEKWVRDGMRPINRRMITLAQRAPWLLRLQLGMLSRMLKNPAKARRWEQSFLNGAPEADKRAFEQFDTTWLVPAAADALRDGGRGAANELVTVARPWGFSLAEIQTPVELWHGTEDQNVPPALARRVADEIPGCVARFLEGEGHALGAAHRDEVMATVNRS